MQIGLILVSLAAVAWAVNSVIIRSVTARAGESFSATAASIFTAVPYLCIVLTVAGEWGTIARISLWALAKLVIAGVIQLLLGRALNYGSVRLIGANKAGPLVATTPLFIMIFALVLLGETLTALIVLGVVFIVGGAALIGTEGRSAAQTQGGKTAGRELKGYLMGLAAAVSYGISSVMVKSAITDIGSPYVSAGIFYFASALGLLLMLPGTKCRTDIMNVAKKNNILLPLIAGGIFATTSEVLFQMALSHSPVSLVAPILSTNILVVFFISFFINRRLEVFTWKIFLGIIGVIAGAFCIYW